MSWIKISFDQELPALRTHSGCIYKEKIYYFGGWNNLYYKNLIEYCIATNQWRYISSSNEGPKERSNHSSCIVEDEMWIFGGFNGIDMNNELFSLNLKTFKWRKLKLTENTPRGRDSHSCVVYENNLYVFGGRGWNQQNRMVEYLNDFYKYNIKEEKWNKIEYKGYTPLNRLLHGSCVYSNFMYLFGGRHLDHRLNDLLEYNFITNKFKLIDLKISPSKRTCRSLILFNHSLYLYGGYDKIGYCQDFWRFDLKLNKWNNINIIGDKPESRCAHICCGSQHFSSFFLFGGEGKDKKSFNDFYIFNDKFNNFQYKIYQDLNFLDLKINTYQS